MEAYGNVYSSASSMFVFIKNSIKRCTALSNGQVRRERRDREIFIYSKRIEGERKRIVEICMEKGALKYGREDDAGQARRGKSQSPNTSPFLPLLFSSLPSSLPLYYFQFLYLSSLATFMYYNFPFFPFLDIFKSLQRIQNLLATVL